MCLKGWGLGVGVMWEWLTDLTSTKLKMKGLFVLFLFGSAMAFPPMPTGDPTAAIEGLVTRILGPSFVDKFVFKVIPDENGFDVFEVAADLEQNKPILSGNNGVALASAFSYYLKYTCNCSISWGRNGTGDQLRLPGGTLLLPKNQIRMVFPNKFRYYQNVCTVSYSMAWWSWARWEREIDWMAMNGLNFILSFTGQEYVWQKFYDFLGLTDAEIKEFFSGPAFLAWQRMGNIRGWGGPLDDGWIKKQADIQKQVVERIRQFGMINILPGFAGHVPKGLQRIYPSAKLTRNAQWGRFGANYSEDYLLEPTDPLFLTLGQQFYKMLVEEFGTDHYFNADTYNEMNPSSSDLTFLKETNMAIYDAMAKVDSEAVFVMQGWLFHSGYWNNTRIQAFLSGVPNDSMIILDLNSEQSPVWSSTQSYYGKPFIWCLLHNYGGTRGIYGDLSNIGTSPIASRKTPGSTMMGVGMTPEAIEHNPVVYDLMGEMSWRSEEVTDMMGWLNGYITRRYANWTLQSQDAWQLLLGAAYSFHWSWSIRSIATRGPSFTLSTDMAFVPAMIADAWQMLVTAINDGNLDGSVGPLRYDIVDIGRQVLMNLFADVYKLYAQTAQLYYKSNETTLVKEIELLGSTLIDILTDADTLLATDINFLLGNWLEDARQSAPEGASQDVLDLIQFNARNQITMWGPSENIEDYAGKEWAGSVGTYYIQRWKIFIDEVTKSIQESKPFNMTDYGNKRFQFEQSWDYEKTSYPTAPQGDTIEVANMIMKKYLRSEADIENSYTMMVNKTVNGNDLYGQTISLWTNSTGQFAWFCDMNPNCAGFTTPGPGFKSSVANTNSSTGITLYVKKNKAHS